ncbi:hypothetical protein L7F22_030677 [Adiantum nelumboides]|nr:hypothetical protein [Adiantum nelumboides]
MNTTAIMRWTVTSQQKSKLIKETEAMAMKKSGMPNWLLPDDDQEVEEWNLGSEEDPKMIKINKHLKKELKDIAWNLFLKFKDVFAWEHISLKGVDPEVCQHRIPLKPDAKPIRLQRYSMNPNYAKKAKEKIDNLLKARFIIDVESNDWLFPIVVVLKKNGKLRVCVDYRKLNAQIIKDPFALPFTDMMLDEIGGHEMYSFMDGYSGLAKELQLKEFLKVDDMYGDMERLAMLYNGVMQVPDGGPSTSNELLEDGDAQTSGELPKCGVYEEGGVPSTTGELLELGDLPPNKASLEEPSLATDVATATSHGALDASPSDESSAALAAHPASEIDDAHPAALAADKASVAHINVAILASATSVVEDGVAANATKATDASHAAFTMAQTAIDYDVDGPPATIALDGVFTTPPAYAKDATTPTDVVGCEENPSDNEDEAFEVIKIDDASPVYISADVAIAAVGDTIAPSIDDSTAANSIATLEFQADAAKKVTLAFAVATPSHTSPIDGVGIIATPKRPQTSPQLQPLDNSSTSSFQAPDGQPLHLSPRCLWPVPTHRRCSNLEAFVAFIKPLEVRHLSASVLAPIRNSHWASQHTPCITCHYTMAGFLPLHFKALTTSSLLSSLGGSPWTAASLLFHAAQYWPFNWLPCRCFLSSPIWATRQPFLKMRS